METAVWLLNTGEDGTGEVCAVSSIDAAFARPGDEDGGRVHTGYRDAPLSENGRRSARVRARTLKAAGGIYTGPDNQSMLYSSTNNYNANGQAVPANATPFLVEGIVNPGDTIWVCVQNEWGSYYGVIGAWRTEAAAMAGLTLEYLKRFGWDGPFSEIQSASPRALPLFAVVME